MNVQDIISKALIYYDRSTIVTDFLHNYTDLVINKTDDYWKRSIFKFIDKNTGNVVLESEVEVIAIYYDKHRIWSWAWAQVGLTYSENYLAKKMLHYSLDLESDLSYIKSILTSSRGIIEDVTQIDINLAIAANIIKQPYIYSHIYAVENYNLVYYYILLNKDRLEEIYDHLMGSVKSSSPTSDDD